MAVVKRNFLIGINIAMFMISSNLQNVEDGSFIQINYHLSFFKNHFKFVELIISQEQLVGRNTG